MSYDRMREETQTATCACGGGTVTRIWYYEMNDWNQTREGYSDFEIHCDACKNKYHTEYCYHGKSDYYLVPNGKTTHHTADILHFNFRLKEKLVANYPLEDLKLAIKDMISSRYSTRLSESVSKSILSDYYCYYKKKSLPPIIEMLQDCATNYDSYEWTYEKMQAYKLEEKKKIDENNKVINEVLKESYPLDFE